MTLMANGKKILGYALGDTEFYSIDGSDTSVNANGKTYYAIDDSDTSVTASGKTWYAVPSQVTISSGAGVFCNGGNATSWEDQNLKCVAASDSYYYVVGYLVTGSDGSGINLAEGEDTSNPGSVAKSDCTDIVW